jgi:hypothetical protein
MSDAVTFLVLLAANGLLSVGLGGLITRWKRNWTRRRVIYLAAAPVPLVLGLLCSLIVGRAFIDALTNPKSCGVDACAMEMAFGTMALGALLAIYLLSLMPAWIGAKFAR